MIIAKIPVEVHFVPMKINKKDIKDIIAFCENESIELVSFLKLVPHGRARENIETILLTKEDDAEVQQELYSIKSKGAKIRIGMPFSKNNGSTKCNATDGKLYIKYDGCVFGCEAFKYINYKEENSLILPDSIYEKRIDEIVKTSTHLRKSRDLVNAYSTVIIGCENCPVQKYLRTMEVQNELHD